MAIDREQLVELIGRGEAPAYGWVPNGTSNYDPQTYSWSGMSADERKRKAQQLYREAGYGPNKVFRTEIRYNTNATHRTVAVAIQSMWKTVLGVDAELVSEEFQVLLQNIQQKDSIKIFRLNWDGDYNDAHTFLSTFESDNPSNLTGYQSDEFDSLMQRAASQTDPRLRKAYLEEAEVRMLRDHPMIPIYFFVNKHMVSPSVIGWGDNVLNYHYSQHLSFAADE
jgi:ABC-type oligopeptide transport system substrate-binding subunit